MDVPVFASILAGALMLVGVLGIVIPVLPGSITILVGLFIWALGLGNATGWTVFGIAGAVVVAGMVATLVLTGRALRRERIPNRSVVVGFIAGVIGMFVLPGFGLIIGFLVGLFVAELVRVREPAKAVRTSWQALKATGFGLLVELCCATVAITIWVVGLFVYFG